MHFGLIEAFRGSRLQKAGFIKEQRGAERYDNNAEGQPKLAVALQQLIGVLIQKEHKQADQGIAPDDRIQLFRVVEREYKRHQDTGVDTAYRYRDDEGCRHLQLRVLHGHE
jgi:hypothetical protein